MLVVIAHVPGIKGMQVHLEGRSQAARTQNLTQQQFNLKSYHLFIHINIVKN